MDGSVAVWMCHHCDEKGNTELEEDYPFMSDGGSTHHASHEVEVKTTQSSAASIYGLLSESQYKYLEDRGISKGTADRCGLVSQSMYIPKRESNVPCIGFPYVNDDETVGVKWRDGIKNFIQTGKAKSLWRIREFTEGDLVITEGEMDALSFEEIGIPAVSVPNGAPAKVSEQYDEKSKKYMYLWNSKECIDKASRVIIATDGDIPGQALAEEIARRIGKAKCWRMQYPDGCKDPNDVLVQRGPDALREALEKATPWPIGGLRDVNDYKDQALALFRGGMEQSIDVKVGQLSDILKPSPGTLLICTGIPGSGKSTFLTWLSLVLAEHHDWPIAVFSAETTSQVHLLQLSSLVTKKPFIGHNKMTEDELNASFEWLNDRFVFIDESDTSVDSIIERGQAAVMRRGVRVLMIDPYNFLTNAGSGKDENNTNTVKEMLVKLKGFACEHDISVWLVAHPRMMYRNNGANSTPGGYDIAGSAHFFNVADNGITVERIDDEPNVSRIVSWKSRFPWIGATGSVKLSFDPLSGEFSQLKVWGDIPTDWDLND